MPAALGLSWLAVGGVLVAEVGICGMAVVLRLVCGAGFMLANVFFAKMVTGWFAKKEIAAAMGDLIMASPLRIALGQVGHGWLAEAFGWHMAFYAMSAFCVAGFPLVGCLCRPSADGKAPASIPCLRVSLRELRLASLAALVRGAFNGALIIYLGFAPKLLGRAGSVPLGAAYDGRRDGRRRPAAAYWRNSSPVAAPGHSPQTSASRRSQFSPITLRIRSSGQSARSIAAVRLG